MCLKHNTGRDIMDIQGHNISKPDIEEMSVREKIIAATLGLIEKEGAHGLTTRAIASEANVNIAAINYYFGSKQKLVEETLLSALNHMFSDTADFITQMGDNSDDLLRNIMLYFLQGSTRYPGIIKAMLQEPINNNNYNDASVQQLMGFLGRLISQIEQAMQTDKANAGERLMQIFSVALLPALLPEMFKKILGEDFTENIEKQKRYIEIFFNQI